MFSLLVDTIDISQYIINNNWSWGFTRGQELSTESFDIDLVGIEEFQPLSDKYILNGRIQPKVSVYTDGRKLTEGLFSVLSYNDGKSTINIYPEITKILETSRDFFYAENNPAEILRDVFLQLDYTKYLDSQTLNRLKGLFDQNHVVTELNTISTDNDKTTLRDVLSAFKRAFLVEIFIRNNKIYFETIKTPFKRGVPLSDDFVTSFDEQDTDESVVNALDIDINGTAFNETDVSQRQDLYVASQNRFGRRPFDISQSIWKPSVGGYLLYISDLFDSILLQRSSTSKVLNLKTTNNILPEIDVLNYITYRGIIFQIDKLSQSDYSLNLTLRKV